MTTTTTSWLFMALGLCDVLIVLLLLTHQTRLRAVKKKILSCMEQLDDKPERLSKYTRNQIKGLIDEARIRNKASEMIADRAFNMASSANLAIMHLQKTLQVRPYANRRKMVENEKIQSDVMETVGGSTDYSGFDWMYPILSDEERDLVDKAREHNAKYKEEEPQGK